MSRTTSDIASDNLRPGQHLPQEASGGATFAHDLSIPGIVNMTERPTGQSHEQRSDVADESASIRRCDVVIVYVVCSLNYKL